MRYERNLFAVLYAPRLSGNLFYLTNDLLAPLSPPPLSLALSISLTFLPSLLSLSLWACCPSTRLSQSFSLLHLTRLLSWKSLIKFHGSGRFLNDLHSPADKSLHSTCRSFPPCAILSMVPDWHMACVSQLSGENWAPSHQKMAPFSWTSIFTSSTSGGFLLSLLFSCLSADLFPWKPLASDNISLPGACEVLKPIKLSFVSAVDSQAFSHGFIYRWCCDGISWTFAAGFSRLWTR